MIMVFMGVHSHYHDRFDCWKSALYSAFDYGFYALSDRGACESEWENRYDEWTRVFIDVNCQLSCYWLFGNVMGNAADNRTDITCAVAYVVYQARGESAV